MVNVFSELRGESAYASLQGVDQSHQLHHPHHRRLCPQMKILHLPPRSRASQP